MVRAELSFALHEWTASYRLHYGYNRPVDATDIVRVSDWAAGIDGVTIEIGEGLGALRASNSVFSHTVATEISRPNGWQHLLLTPDAVQNGGDDVLPVMSAGQSVQIEWKVAARGRGVNGRTYFPYFGGTAFDAGFVDQMNPATVEAVAFVCNQHAAFTPSVLGAQLCVLSRMRDGIPVHPTDSFAVVGTVVRSSKFRHQRRRVQASRRFTPIEV